MNIREIAVSRLREYENNPRNNDLAVDKVKCSIERFGFLFPIVVDINYVIVCGHTRVRACRELGITSVPCVIADELTEEQVNFFRLVDNKTSEYSDWDFEKLKNELSLIDLTIDKNQLLLEQFDLSAEVFDIDAEQAEIKVPAFNFLGVDAPVREKKPAVNTISGDSFVESDDASGAEETAPSESYSEYSNPQAPANQDYGSDMESSSDFEAPESSSSESELNAEHHKESKPALPIYQFRFGDVAFFISKVELDHLNKKYAEYIDSEAALKISFANYLLEGVENCD